MGRGSARRVDTPRGPGANAFKRTRTEPHSRYLPHHEPSEAAHELVHGRDKGVEVALEPHGAATHGAASLLAAFKERARRAGGRRHVQRSDSGPKMIKGAGYNGLAYPHAQGRGASGHGGAGAGADGTDDVIIRVVRLKVLLTSETASVSRVSARGGWGGVGTAQHTTEQQLQHTRHETSARAYCRSRVVLQPKLYFSSATQP